MLVNQKKKRKKKCRPVWCIQKKKGNLGHVTASKQRKTGQVDLSNESSITSHRFSFSCKAIKDSLKLLFTSSVDEENTNNLTFWLIKAYVNTTMTKTINYFPYPNQSFKEKWVRCKMVKRWEKNTERLWEVKNLCNIICEKTTFRISSSRSTAGQLSTEQRRKLSCFPVTPIAHQESIPMW